MPEQLYASGIYSNLKGIPRIKSSLCWQSYEDIPGVNLKIEKPFQVFHISPASTLDFIKDS